jgi:hypothetical protein
MTKEEAARKAAAMYSTNLIAAVIEYAKLTGQVDQLSDFNKIQKQFLGAIPIYRHPANGRVAEYMIFIDPDCLELDGSILEMPEFLSDVAREGVSDQLLAKIKGYVLDAERERLSLVQARSKQSEAQDAVESAQQVYHDNLEKRSSTRNSAVVRELGLSSGTTPLRLDKKAIYNDYVFFVRRKALPRREAMEETRRKYGVNSCDRVQVILFEYRDTMLKKWEREHPNLVPDIRLRLRGLIPARR